jgi:polysaccharide export outer membrane protein/exopolysaccharide production protein ExoF
MLAAALLVTLTAAPVRAGEGAYRLGPQDKVRVKVYEWRAARGDVYEWAALNGEFTVGAGGDLALPLIGEVPAAGQTPAAVAAAVAARLKAKAGLRSEPDAAIEVVQYRPFYIVGAVDHPGAFPYQPGLTVLQALGLAGGMRRTLDPDIRQIQREVVSGQGDLTVYAVQTRGLLIRKARLDAERKGLDSIVWPSGLQARAADPAVAQLMAQETLIFQTRHEALSTQLEALTQLKGFLASEIGSITQQLALEDRQLALIREDLKSASSLREKGLVVAPRVLQLERTEAEAEGDRLRMNTALLQAKQESSKTDLTMLDLQNSRHNEIATSLRDTQDKLDELAKRAATAAVLVQDAEDTVPQVLAERRGKQARTPIFTILRRDGDRTVAQKVSDSAAVQPGDTIRVELPPDPAIDDASLVDLLGRRPSVSAPAGTLARAGADAAVPQN